MSATLTRQVPKYAARCTWPLSVVLALMFAFGLAHLRSEAPAPRAQAIEGPQRGFAQGNLRFADCPNDPGTVCGIPIDRFKAVRSLP